MHNFSTFKDFEKGSSGAFQPDWEVWSGTCPPGPQVFFHCNFREGTWWKLYFLPLFFLHHMSKPAAVLADVILFCIYIIHCLRMWSLSQGHLFTLLLNELQPLWQLPSMVISNFDINCGFFLLLCFRFFLAVLKSEHHLNSSLLIVKPICRYIYTW